mgnify:CR=1 FL=1
MDINHEEVYELLEEGKKATREDILSILEKAKKRREFLIKILQHYFN